MEKVYIYLFTAFGVVAAVGVALGAYWHIFTAAACALLVWSIKKDIKTNKNR